MVNGQALPIRLNYVSDPVGKVFSIFFDICMFMRRLKYLGF